MSYVLFSRTSVNDGARNLWVGSTVGQSTDATVGGVAASTFDEIAIVDQVALWGVGEAYDDGQLLSTKANIALYDLSEADADSADASFNTKFAEALQNNGNVLGVAASFTVAGSASDRTLDGESGYRLTEAGDARGFAAGLQLLDIGLADINWNDIKNVEVRIDSDDTGTGFDAVALRSFVDARVKVGSEGEDGKALDAAAVAATRAAGDTFFLQILDGKRGQIDGAASDMALNARIDVWTNAKGWQNSFSNTGSIYNDVFEINYGELAVAMGVSEYGLGAGSLVDATDATYDAGEADNQSSVYNGALTTLFTNMGDGDDLYDATSGVSVEALETGTKAVEAELQTIDYVWGGSGDDVIRAGGGRDILFGDFGSIGSIGQNADPTGLLTLELGSSDDSFASWKVDGLVDRIWQQLRGLLNVNGVPAIRTATAENWDQFFRVEENYAGLPSVSGVGAGSSTSTTTNGGANNVNPEINAGATGVDNGTADDDRLGFEFAKPIAAAEVDLGLFYADGGIETALVTIQDGGVELATYQVTAAGVVSKVSGPETFDLALADGGDARTDGDPGEAMLSIGSPGGRTFDGLVFSTLGAANASNEVSDYYIKAIRLTVAPEAGNDVIDAGSGADRIEGGGDRGSITLFHTEGDELLINGGFETQAAGAAFTGEGSYLTKGGVDAGADFGWFALGTALNPAQNLEVWQDSNGGIDAYTGSNKLELDSAPIDEANPIVRQNVATVDGGLYELSFVFAERDGDGDGSSNFGLNWSGVAIGNFAKPANASHWTFVAQLDTGVEVTIEDVGETGGWHRATVTGLIGDGLDDFVQFRAAAAQTNLFGAFIDDVSLVAARDAFAVEIGDRLTGGEGRDTFVWRKGDGVDLIEDFAFGDGGDVLDFDGAFMLTEIDLDFDHMFDSVIVHASKDAKEGVILKNVLASDLVLGGGDADIV